MNGWMDGREMEGKEGRKVMEGNRREESEGGSVSPKVTIILPTDQSGLNIM